MSVQVLKMYRHETRCNMTFWVTLNHWHQHQHNIMPMASSVASLHSSSQDDQYEVQHDILLMWCHWHQCQQHVMLTALSVAPLYLLGQADWNELQYDFLGHVMPLVPALHYMTPIVSSVAPFYSLVQDNGNKVKYDCGSCDAKAACIGVTWQKWCHQ